MEIDFTERYRGDNRRKNIRSLWRASDLYEYRSYAFDNLGFHHRPSGMLENPAHCLNAVTDTTTRAHAMTLLGGVA